MKIQQLNGTTQPRVVPKARAPAGKIFLAPDTASDWRFTVWLIEARLLYHYQASNVDAAHDAEDKLDFRADAGKQGAQTL